MMEMRSWSKWQNIFTSSCKNSKNFKFSKKTYQFIKDNISELQIDIKVGGNKEHFVATSVNEKPHVNQKCKEKAAQFKNLKRDKWFVDL